MDLLALDQKPLSEFSLADLKRSILAVTNAEENWSTERGKPVASPVSIDLRRYRERLDQLSYITKFTSKHLVIPLMSGALIGWDLKTQAPAGSIELPVDSMLMDLALDASSRSLVCLSAIMAHVR